MSKPTVSQRMVHILRQLSADTNRFDSVEKEAVSYSRYMELTTKPCCVTAEEMTEMRSAHPEFFDPSGGVKREYTEKFVDAVIEVRKVLYVVE